MATIFKSKYTGEQIELLLGDVEILKGVNLEQQTIGTPFTIDEATKQTLFSETPPIITVQIEDVTVNLYRIAINSEKAYYTNTIEINDTTYFITIVVNSNLQCEINSTLQLVIPQPTQENADKILKVNAVGNGFELVEIYSLLDYATELEINELFDNVLGTWLFNENITGNISTVGLSYQYDNKVGDNLLFISGSLTYGTSFPDLTVVYQDGSWVDNKYRTITITDVSNTSNLEEFKSWLTSNATKQSSGGGTSTTSKNLITVENLEQFKQKCDETYAPIGGGTEVVANNGEATTETLTTLKVGDTNYEVPQGGGSGGTPIDAGYTLSITSDGESVYPRIVVLGLYNGTYGWHDLSNMSSGVVKNASMMYVKSAIANLSRAGSSMTTNAIYDLANKALTKDTLYTYRGLACILKDCTISISS